MPAAGHIRFYMRTGLRCHSSHQRRRSDGGVPFSVQGTKTLLNGPEFLVKGLRCSNALISDAATDELVGNLDLFAGYGVNTVSVFFQGSRFGDVVGYREDATLDPVHAARMGRLIEAADARAIVELIIRQYHPHRVFQWGSLLRPGDFKRYSDIDIAIEGVTDAERFFALLGEAQAMSRFPLDIVQLEKIAPEYADDIRRHGKIVYEHE